MAIVTVGIDLAKNVFAATLAEVRSSEGLGGTLRWRNVKVQHIFAHSQFCVESDCRLVSVVCLHKDDVNAAFGGELLKLANHGRGYALPPMALIDGEVVYVQL